MTISVWWYQCPLRIIFQSVLSKTFLETICYRCLYGVKAINLFIFFQQKFFQKGGVSEALNERELFNAVSDLNFTADNEADFLAEVSFWLGGWWGGG